MLRKEVFKEIGKLKPSVSEKSGEVNFSSIFIVPIPHNVHDIRQTDHFFDDVAQYWDVRNNSAEKDLFLWDIKQYIIENVFEPIDLTNKKSKRECISGQKNILLSNKGPENKNISFTFDGLKLVLSEIDLWIMDGNIAFFAYKIRLDKDAICDINTISTKINRSLRDYKRITIDLKEKEVYYNSKKGIPLLEYFMRTTMNTKKESFLNTTYKDENFNVSKDIAVVNDSTFYAKTITALHIQESSVCMDNQTQEIAPISESLTEDATINIGILEELPYLLATTSSYDFDKELSFVAHGGYVYPTIKEQGINIWKFWSGIALQDAVAFFSIDQGGAGIVYQARTSNYFLYVLNLYISTRLKYIESYLIDKDFINIERILPLVQEIQVLKNHYIASEISLKFQPNAINKKICTGLKNNELLGEVENNLEKTLEYTKYNTDIVFSAVAGVVTLSGIWLNGDLISNLYDKHPYVTFTIGTIVISLMGYIVVKKSVVIKFIKGIIKKAKRYLGI